jgi:hypothetical protein
MRKSPALASVWILAGALAAPAVAAKPAARPAEEGIWKVQVTPDAEAAAKGEKAFEDTLILKKGKFRSTACEPYGFGPAAYRVEGTAFLADPESGKEGKSHWHGEVDGDGVTGRMRWTKPDGTVFNYTFEGHRAGSQTQTRKS